MMNSDGARGAYSISNRGGRIEYIDALRGFTMLMVVFHHVAYCCWKMDINEIPSVHNYLLQVRMPMFFFISGFVLYKSNVTWNSAQVLKFFKKKLPVQLFTPFLFLLLSVHISGTNLLIAISDPDKNGFWFTFVLLEYYVFYVSVKFLIRKCWASIVLVIIGLAFYLINFPPIMDSIPLLESTKGILSIQRWHFFLFFVLGTIVKKHFIWFESFLDRGWFLTCCILIYFLGNGFRSIIPVNSTIIGLILTLTGLTILFSFFRIKKDIFSRQSILGRSLQCVGRRTLDIYLIHTFLLPTSLSIFTLFKDHPMPVIEATSSLLVSIIIVAACLLISNIIRLSPFLAHWMFGAKNKVNT